MKKILFVVLILVRSMTCYGQGFNHQWLLGYWNFQDDKGKLLFNSSNYTPVIEQRKMTFYGTQANISDAGGNLLMASNGIWIANATGDTMMNGAGLNPSYLATAWPLGIPFGHGNLTIPFPGDSSKLILMHMARWSQFALTQSALYKTEELLPFKSRSFNLRCLLYKIRFRFLAEDEGFEPSKTNSLTTKK